MIAETIYWIAKIYFMIAGFYYLYALYTGTLDTFAHVTGIIAVLFLISNIIWYFFKK
ncbi:MAG: hypothetical protein AABX14_01045 [Candidatus Aenigmatarchaeota archaeon]